ncbi:MAG: CDP-diacylglycerol--glycerol-3-phosphate 3-phosphatidyltransferase [Pseudomonadota bacterium]
MLPNLLTFARIALVPMVVAGLLIGGAGGAAVALGGFVIASLTDWLDGALARAWNQQSALGALLDPIADKLLVCAVLVTLTATAQIAGWHVAAVLLIVLRELAVSGAREFMAGHAGAGSLPVGWVGKTKTAVQMLAVATLIATPLFDGDVQRAMQMGGLTLLWAAAALSVYSALGYFRTAITAAVRSDSSA